MPNAVVDAVFNKVRETLQPIYPDMTFYKYDPRAHDYQRPFAAVQHRGVEATNLPTSTIGINARRHNLDIIIGLKDGNPDEIETELVNAGQAVLNAFQPWSYLTSDLLIENVYTTQETESISRLRDFIIIKLSVVSV